MPEERKLGAEVEGWCTKCRDMTVHHLVSLAVEKKPARVRCKACDGEHNFRPNPPQSRKSGREPRLAGAGHAPTPRVGSMGMNADGRFIKGTGPDTP